VNRPPAATRPALTRPALTRPALTRLALAALAALAVSALVAGSTRGVVITRIAATSRAVHPAAASTTLTTSAAATAARRAGTAARATPPCDPTASLRPAGPPRVTPGSFMAKIRARGYLIAGLDPTRYHFESLNPRDGEMEGFEIDLLHAIAKAIFGNPNDIRYLPLQDEQRIPYLRSGAVDIVAQDMTITCARWKVIDFSSVYMDSGQQVLVESDSPFKHVTSLGQLAGQKVCAVTGSIELANIGAATPHPIPVGEPYWTDCLVLLQQGAVAAISSVTTDLIGLEGQDPYAQIVSPRLDFEPQGLGISQKHPDFVRFVNAVLAQMRSDGQWATSYAQWIGTPVPAPPPARYKD
jgi:polar amino acid transport system substrate-binding protein